MSETTLNDAINRYEHKVDEQPKTLWFADAERIYKPEFELPNYKRDLAPRLATGFEQSVLSLQDIPETIEIYGDMIDLGFSEYFNSDVDVERKQLNLATAQRNLLNIQRERQRTEALSPAEQETLGYNVGGGLMSYGVMLTSGGVGGAIGKALGLTKKGAKGLQLVAGVGTMATLELGEQVSERIPVTEEGEVDIEKLTPEWARKTSGATLAYLTTSAILEKKTGYGSQLNTWSKPIKLQGRVGKILQKAGTKGGRVLATAGKTALSEGATEGLQSLAATGFLLADGTIDMSKLPERIKQAWLEFQVGTILGSASGTAVSINQRANIKRGLHEIIDPVVANPEEAKAIVDGIYDTGNAQMTTIISKELELSSQLQAKHGFIYDNMSKSIDEAIKESGAFKGVPEDELAQYVSDTSKLFADQAMAEANKRGVLLDGIIKGADIRYENGMIRLANGDNIVAEDPVGEQAKIEPINAVEELEQMSQEELRLFEDFLDPEEVAIAERMLDRARKGEKFEVTEDVATEVDKEALRANLAQTTADLENFIRDIKAPFEVYNKFPEYKNLKKQYDSAQKAYRDSIVLRQEVISPQGIKEVQLNIINKANPAPNETDAWVREVRDILSFQEALFLRENLVTAKDFTEADMQQAVQQGEVEVYANEPITDGVFVTPSRARAEKGGEVFSQTVPLSDVAWLSTIEGQYAETSVLRQDAQPVDTNSKAFKDWFGKSVIRDGVGNPTVVYHGTMADFSEFKKQNEIYAAYSKNFYFTRDKNRAKDYGNRVMEVYLKTDHPFNTKFPPSRQEIEIANRVLEERGYDKVTGEKNTGAYTTGENFLNDLGVMTEQDYDFVLQSMGYDSIVADNEIVVFEPTQIKSVDNRGTFDPQDPNIFRQEARGRFNVSQKAIEITETADFSTLPHELSHFWLDNMFNYVRTGQASEGYLKNFQAIKKWLGIDDAQPFLTRNQQEKFARGYERYLTEGNLPNRLVGNALDDYDKWLKRVYAGAKIKGKMKPEVVEFFKTMTTGQLVEPSDYTPSETLVERTREVQKEIVKDAEEVRVEKEKEFSKTPVETSTDFGTKESSVFKKQAELAGIEQALEYDVANIEEQNKLAEEYLQSNFEDVVEIVNGRKEAPRGILKNAIYNAYLKQMLETGNTTDYVNALRNQSLELTRAGQEIASQRGVMDNIFSPAYWISDVENGRKRAISKDYDTIVDETIDNFIDDVLSKETPAEQQEEINKIAKSLGKSLKVKPEELFQKDSLETRLEHKNSSYNYIKNKINESLGVNLSQKDAEALISQSENLKKNALKTVDENGNPSVGFFKILGDTENLANSLNPTNPITVLTSIAGRGAMLASLKSPFLNIESNLLNAMAEKITRRAAMKLTSDVPIDIQVDKQLMKDYMKYSSDIYNSSGYTISSMLGIDPEILIKGERFEHSQGKGVIRKIGRFYEQTVFKYLLGANDRYMKDVTFLDSAALEATKQARIEKAPDIGKRADEIFKDVLLIEPQTETGEKIREIAVNEALVATYMNSSALSEITLKMREVINKATGPIEIGNLISPFVKTPANVMALGLESTFGGAIAVKNMNTIINDFKTGKITDTTRRSIRGLSRNTLGVLASIIIAAGFIDDEDYIPDYELLTPSQRKLVQAKNGVFNSIKVGNRYVNLDYFGPLAMPLVAVLEARRKEGVVEQAFGFLKGASNQLFAAPVIGDLKDLYSDVSRKLTQEGYKTLEGLGDWAIDFTTSRTIPSIVTDVAKMFDEYERDTNRSSVNRAISKLPFARETLPKKYNVVTGRPIKVEPTNLFFGARVKTEVLDYSMSEIDRLEKSGNHVSISDPTNYGLLKTLPDEQKINARREFAQQYSEEIYKEMNRASWDRKDNEEQAKKLNKIRAKVVKDIKKDYGLQKKRN